MLHRDLLIFLAIQLAMISYSHAEAYQEGKEGWKWNPKWWRIPLPGGYWYTAYHVFVFYLTFPVLIFGIPFALVGFSNHLFLVLLFSYLIGTTLQDFVWFLVNKDYPFRKWNPKETKWYPWVSVGNIALPTSYVTKILISLIIGIILLKDYL